MAEHEVAIPEIAGRVTITEPGLFSGSRLLVNGKPAEKAGWGKFWLPRTDGGRAEARLVAGFTTWVPSLMVGGVRHDVGPKLPIYLAVLAFLPFTLMFVGGALGGLCGGLGAGLNHQIARTDWPLPLKLVAMLAVTGAAVGTFMMVATALHLAIGK